jgi:putative copper export protein
LTDLVREVEEAVFYLFVALLVEALLHVVQTVEELEQSEKAADDLDLQKLLFVGLAVLHTVVSLRNLGHDVHQFFDLQ